MIIGLSGHIKSGKSTAANLIRQFKSNFEEKYFAFKLKYIASYLTGEDQKLFETQEGKEGFLEEWGMTRREILQKLGTESLRNNLHNDVWIKALFADYKPTQLCNYPDWIVSDTRFKNEADEIKKRGGKILRINRPFSIIYPDQWEKFVQFETHRQNNFTEERFVAWLSIGNREQIDLYHKLVHLSETELDNYDGFDYVINNTGSFEDFFGDIQKFLNTL